MKKQISLSSNEEVRQCESIFDCLECKKELIKVIEFELIKFNSLPENSLLQEDIFVNRFSEVIDSIVIRKFSSRAFSNENIINISYSNSILPNNDSKVICKIEIKTFFNSSKTAIIFFNDGNDNFFCEADVSHNRKFHPFIEVIASRMQNKLNLRQEKYKNVTYDNWKELNRTALLKHFDEECLEYKSEIYRFIDDINRPPKFEEIDNALDELADIANIGFMLIGNIINNNKEVLPKDTPIGRCANCGREVKEPLIVKGMCYKCYKLENLK